jgi:hypothetical protein
MLKDFMGELSLYYIQFILLVSRCHAMKLRKKQNGRILPRYKWYRCVEEMDEEMKVPSCQKGICSEKCEKQTGQQMHTPSCGRQRKEGVIQGPPVGSRVEERS